MNVGRRKRKRQTEKQTLNYREQMVTGGEVGSRQIK